MKIIFLICILTLGKFNFLESNEPFVVLEYQANSLQDSGEEFNSNNKFLKNRNYSTSHKVKSGESLSGIINKYYGKTGLNMRIVEVSLIEINRHAFVRKNPNFLYAGKKLKIPSINEIKNLVMNKSSTSRVNTGRSGHIYFYGN